MAIVISNATPILNQRIEYFSGTIQAGNGIFISGVTELTGGFYTSGAVNTATQSLIPSGTQTTWNGDSGCWATLGIDGAGLPICGIAFVK